MDVVRAPLGGVLDDQCRPRHSEIDRAAVGRRPAPGEVSVGQIALISAIRAVELSLGTMLTHSAINSRSFAFCMSLSAEPLRPSGLIVLPSCPGPKMRLGILPLSNGLGLLLLVQGVQELECPVVFAAQRPDLFAVPRERGGLCAVCVGVSTKRFSTTVTFKPR